MKKLYIVVFILFLFAFNQVSGQDLASYDSLTKKQTFMPLTPVTVYFGFEMGVSTIAPTVQKEFAMGQGAFGIGFDLGLIFFDVADLYVAVGGSFPKDEARFSQTVKNQTSGKISNAKSSLEFTTWDFAIGPRTPYLHTGKPNSTKYAGLALLGRYGTSSSKAKRSISDCQDCRVDKFKMGNGTFFDLGLDISIFDAYRDWRWNIVLTRRTYTSGSPLNNRTFITFNALL